MTREMNRRNFIKTAGAGAIGAGLAVSAPALADPVPASSQRSAAATGASREPIDYVNPFIGTARKGSRWMLFPGAAMPFGMVKLSPDNRPASRLAGYDYEIGTLLGFSHVHSWTMGGLLMMPTTGPLKIIQGPPDGSPDSFRSPFSHDTESASPGYYAVTLDAYKIRCELTATTRAGFQRYTFPKTDQARILMALNVPGEYTMAVQNAVIRRVSDTEIEGQSEQTNIRWATFQKYTLYFVIRFSKPFDFMGGWIGSNITQDTQQINGQGDMGAFVNYRTAEGEVIQVKTGISYVSIEQARLNLDTEMNRFGWDFDAVRKNASDTWNDLLKKIEVEGGSESDRTKFYTNMYRSFVARTIFSDVNGKYVDPTGQVRQLKDPESPMLGSDAFWNTFWNLNQLWGLATPKILSHWVKSELQLNQDGGWLSRGPAGLRYSGVMVAEHEIAILVGAWQKGIRDFDGETAYAAIKHVLTTPGKEYYPEISGVRGGWVGMKQLKPYRELGYVPIEDGEVSLTLEYAYDDWCAAQLAKALGKLDDFAYFSKRAQNYRNVWDPAVGYFRAKHRDGTWDKEFSPLEARGYTEGTAWQYAWWVPHDMKGLIALMGKDEFVRRLNRGFEESRPDFAHAYVNVGNQPNMQAPWLFNYAGMPWLTQKWTREVMERSYSAAPAGYVGDEDQGQMGSYFVMLAMGLFEMDGGCSQKPIYEIGSPLFRRIIVHLDQKYYPGRQFVIEARNNSPQNVYIQSATLNGKPLDNPWIYHSTVVEGATLVLNMGPVPNMSWGSAPAAVPPQNQT